MACGIVYRVPWAMKVFVKISRGGACGGGGDSWTEISHLTIVFYVCLLIIFFTEKQEKSNSCHWKTTDPGEPESFIRRERALLETIMGAARTSSGEVLGQVSDAVDWPHSWCLSFDELLSPSLSPPSLRIWENWWKWDVIPMALAGRWNKQIINLIPAHSWTSPLSPVLALPSCGWTPLEPPCIPQKTPSSEQ